MASVKPVVEKNGELEVLQPGDSINVQPDAITRTFTSTAVKGNVVYVDGNGSVDLAQANASGTASPFGLAAEGVLAAASGVVIFDGVLVATTLEWDAVAGTTGGLSAGVKYFLSSTVAGAMVAQGSQPSAQGEYVVELGHALSTTEFEVQIRRRILL